MALDTCDHIKPLLGAYSDRELDASEAALVQAHLIHCTSCLAELEEIDALGDHLREALVMPALESFATEVTLSLRDTRRPSLAGRALETLRQRWMPALAVASMGLAVSAVVLMMVRWPAPTAAPHPAVMAQAPLSQPSPALPEVAAANGSSETFISRLQTSDPSVAVWSEPGNKTTVIWLPEDNGASGDN